MNASLTTILMIVLILFAPTVWNLSQHHTTFCTVIINTIRSILFKDLNSVDKNLFKLSGNELTLILLYGSTQYSLMNNRILLNSSVEFNKTLNVSLGPYFSVVVFFP